MKYAFLNIFIVMLLLACSTSENPVDEEIEPITTLPIIEVTNFEITINEGPENQTILGIVEASTNVGDLSFTILEQFPENAFSINEDTGEIRVENTGLFNYEVYPIVHGIVEVINGEVSSSATITINLLDVQENNLILRSTDATNIIVFDYSDCYNEINYVNNEINTWTYGHYPKNNDMSFVTSNNLIISYDRYIVDEGSVCNFQFTISYDNSNRISNINLVGEECDYYLNYNMEYIGNTVNFIDQLGIKHKSIVLNDNNQILKYTFLSNIIDLTYDGENLVSILSENNHSVTYEYDNYRNPFKLNETLNFYQIQDFINVMRGDFYFSLSASNILRNTNNITRIVRLNLPMENRDYYYNYNSDDYPINKTTNLGGLVEYVYN